MHPVIRIICFVLFTAFVSHPDKLQLILAGLLVLSLMLYAQVSFQLIGRMLWRLRWFFLSILLIYGWLSPEIQPLAEPGHDLARDLSHDLTQDLSQGLTWTSTLSRWLPATEGIRQGLLRISTLVLIIAAAALLISLTSREQLVAAIYWLSTPLKILGCSRDKLAIRLVLTLEYTKQLQLELGKRESAAPARGGRAGFRAQLKQRARLASELFSYVIKKAETVSVDTVTVDLLSMPPLWQWIYPLLLGTVFYLAGHFSWQPGI